MRTPRNVDIRPMGGGGQYWHQGLEPCLRRIFRDIRTDTSISININIDGLPIYKSTTKNFWPILCNIYEIPSIAPIVVGIFYGYGKPKDVNAFLNPFIDELLPILESGIIIHGHRLSIHIRCFVCDTPARSFIKNVTNFNGKYGCIKCTTKGRFSQLSRTMMYPELNAPLRTDKEFRENQYPDHQRGYTPLVKLPIDMVNDIILESEEIFSSRSSPAESVSYSSLLESSPDIRASSDEHRSSASAAFCSTVAVALLERFGLHADFRSRRLADRDLQ
ncbi:AAEL008504-PA [Aedes aegypti]|uniref:AAEL008504-PA n=1 Tax=Aedes aegypti TaxID=7159 RepID=Q16YL2_AEDAE|nr:AAEL008504-PA [Aedes aegypti]